jgi:putative transposase
MSRKLRIWYPGATHHITARGNKRSPLFFDETDYLTYLHILEDVRSIYPFVLHSYCLMTNHIHLQLETIHHHIQYIMKTLHSRYAVYLNQRMKTDGHIFQGRYKAELIETSLFPGSKPLCSPQSIAATQWSVLINIGAVIPLMFPTN